MRKSIDPSLEVQCLMAHEATECKETAKLHSELFGRQLIIFAHRAYVSNKWCHVVVMYVLAGRMVSSLSALKNTVYKSD